MTLIRHCIIDTTTKLVVNIIEYEEVQTGAPPGLEDHLLCVQSDTGQIGGTFLNGVITNPPEPESMTLPTEGT